MQTFKSILNHTDASVAAGYIHALAPKVLQFLHSEQAQRVASPNDLTLTVESLNVLEALVQLAEPQHSKFYVLYYRTNPIVRLYTCIIVTCNIDSYVVLVCMRL